MAALPRFDSPGAAQQAPGGGLTPKLWSVLRHETYRWPELKQDISAGLTVAIVALPISMAIAIASGASPDSGLYSAIVAGFIISLLGGCRFQIGGPAGAFIVVVASIIERHGMAGLFTATLMAGFLMLAAGWLRLGDFIRYMPHAVVTGFTAAIAVIIFASQVRELLGLSLAGREPSDLLPKLAVLWQAVGSISPQAIAVSAVTLAAILLTRKFRPKWPAFLFGVLAGSLLAVLLGLKIETIGTRFGGIPAGLPAPVMPDLSAAQLWKLLPDALSIAVLGGIESLLSAVVADAMTNRSHRPNAELVAQGLANIVTPLFGGIPATGTLARTAANIRSFAYGPVSGVLHAVFLLAFMMAAAPLAAHIPLAALGAVLAVTAWGMVDKAQVWLILSEQRANALILIVTFLLTIFRTLLEGIAAGVALAVAFALIRRGR